MHKSRTPAAAAAGASYLAGKESINWSGVKKTATAAVAVGVPY